MSFNPKMILPIIKKNLPTILSGVAVVGVGATGWLSYKAALKHDPNKSFREQWKNYIYPIAAGAGTIASILGANCLHLRLEGILAGAVAFYKAAGEDFEDAVFDKFGDSGLKANVMESNKNAEPAPSMDMKIKIWEPYTKQWFRASQKEILWAELTVNKMLQQRGRVTLNDVLKLYSDPKIKLKKYGDSIGWSYDDDSFCYVSSYYYAGSWIDLCPQFEEYEGSQRFVMDYGINPFDISES